MYENWNRKNIESGSELSVAPCIEDSFHQGLNHSFVLLFFFFFSNILFKILWSSSSCRKTYGLEFCISRYFIWVFICLTPALILFVMPPTNDMFVSLTNPFNWSNSLLFLELSMKMPFRNHEMIISFYFFVKRCYIIPSELSCQW